MELGCAQQLFKVDNQFAENGHKVLCFADVSRDALFVEVALENRICHHFLLALYYFLFDEPLDELFVFGGQSDSPRLFLFDKQHLKASQILAGQFESFASEIHAERFYAHVVNVVALVKDDDAVILEF